MIAKLYSLCLADKADFSMVEIFVSPNFLKGAAGAVKDRSPVGFAN
jgi:hypothetical protein